MSYSPRKRGVCSLSFSLLLCPLLSLVGANQVLGPSPTLAYVPVNATATFTCIYEEFDEVTDIWAWTVNGTEFTHPDHPMTVSGGNVSTLRYEVLQSLQQPVPVLCDLHRRSGTKLDLLATGANGSQILTYGEPSSPANLSVCVHGEEVLVSWSSPWSPPGIALNYTVTFLNNSHQVEVDYHTTNTTLTVKGADLTGESSEFPGLCELYGVQVVAESPAGVGPALEEIVPVFKFTGNINISICKESGQFLCSVQLLQPGSCFEGPALHYTLVFNTTDGILEKDIDDVNATVPVDWNVLSAALAVTTSKGFSRSEFYHFSDEERAAMCDPSFGRSMSTILPHPTLSSSPTVLSQVPGQEYQLVLIAISAGGVVLVMLIVILVVVTLVFCFHRSRKQRESNRKLQMIENGKPANGASDKQRASVISATHPIYQLPKDARQEYLNEQELVSKAGSRRASTTSMMMVKDSFAQLAADETDHTVHEKSRSLPRDSITDISGYSVVPQTLKNEIKRRSSRLNGSVKSHSTKTPPLVHKDSSISSPSTDSSPPLPPRNHYSLCTAEGGSTTPGVPPPIPPPLSTPYMTSNGELCHDKIPPLVHKDSLISSPSTDSSPPLAPRNHYSLCTAEGGSITPGDSPPTVPPPLSTPYMTSNRELCHDKELTSRVYSVSCKEKRKSSPPPSSPLDHHVIPSSPISDHTPNPAIYDTII